MASWSRGALETPGGRNEAVTHTAINRDKLIFPDGGVPAGFSMSHACLHIGRKLARASLGCATADNTTYQRVTGARSHVYNTGTRYSSTRLKYVMPFRVQNHYSINIIPGTWHV